MVKSRLLLVLALITVASTARSAVAPLLAPQNSTVEAFTRPRLA
jgi:hypothetical protein